MALLAVTTVLALLVVAGASFVVTFAWGLWPGACVALLGCAAVLVAVLAVVRQR